MTARLVAISYDAETLRYIEAEAAKTEEGQIGLEQLDAFGDLSEMYVELNDLPDGTYTLIVGADLPESTLGRFRLLHNDTGKICFETTWELQPTIASSHQYGKEYSALMMIETDDEEDDETREQARFRLAEIEGRRSDDLEGLLKNHLIGNVSFNIELIDVIDFMTYPVASGYIPGEDEIEEDLIPKADTPVKETAPKRTLH